MRDLKLLPRHDATCADFVRLDFETAVPVVEQVRLLGVDSGQNAYNCPAEEATIRCRVAPVEEGVLLLGVAVDVAVDPYMALLIFSESLEQILDVVNLGVELQVRIYPLPV